MESDCDSPYHAGAKRRLTCAMAWDQETCEATEYCRWSDQGAKGSTCLDHYVARDYLDSQGADPVYANATRHILSCERYGASCNCPAPCVKSDSGCHYSTELLTPLLEKQTLVAEILAQFDACGEDSTCREAAFDRASQEHSYRLIQMMSCRSSADCSLSGCVKASNGKCLVDSKEFSAYDFSRFIPSVNSRVSEEQSTCYDNPDKECAVTEAVFPTCKDTLVAKVFMIPQECNTQGTDCKGVCKLNGSCRADPSQLPQALAQAAGLTGTAAVTTAVEACSAKAEAECTGSCVWFNGVCDADMVALAKTLLKVEDDSEVIKALRTVTTPQKAAGTISWTTDKTPEDAASDFKMIIVNELQVHSSRVTVEVATSRRLQASSTVTLSVAISGLAGEVPGLQTQLTNVAAIEPAVAYTAIATTPENTTTAATTTTTAAAVTASEASDGAETSVAPLMVVFAVCSALWVV